MTLRSTGSFVAYLVIATLLSAFILPTGTFLVGKVSADSTWVVTGRAVFYDANGKESVKPSASALHMAHVRAVPDPNVIDTEVEIKLPFPRDTKPTIYIEVPDWGGAKIPLSDPESYSEDVLKRRIILKNLIQIRQTPTDRLSIGEQQR